MADPATLNDAVGAMSALGLGFEEEEDYTNAEPERVYQRTCELHNRAALTYICGGYVEAHAIMGKVMKLLEAVVLKDPNQKDHQFFKEIFPKMVALFYSITQQYDKVNSIVQANSLFQNGEIPEAIEEWTKAIATGTTYINDILYGNRAQAYLMLGKWEECIQDCLKWQALRKHWHTPHLVKGQAFLQLQLFGEAVKSFEKALSICPDENAKNNFLNPALELAMQKTELLRDLQEEEDDDEDEEVEKDSDTYYPKAKEALSEKRYLDALLLLSDANDVKPNNSAVLSLRAQLYFELKMFDFALDDIELSIKADEKAADAHYLHANILYELHQYKEAEDAIASALTIDDKNESYLNLMEKIDTAIQKQTAEEEKLCQDKSSFFEKLIKDQADNIKLAKGDKGLGLFANKEYKKGDIIFKDKPDIVFQLPKNKMEVVGCAACSKPLEYTELGLLEAAKALIKEMENDPSVAEQYGGIKFDTPEELRDMMRTAGLDKAHTPFWCEFCNNEAYCSDVCRKDAFDKFHQRLCLGPNCPETHPMIRLMEMVKKSNVHMVWFYPYFLANVIQRLNTHSDPDSVKELWMYYSYDGNQHPGASTQEQNELLDLCKDALYDERVGEMYTPNFFWKIVSLRARNCVTCDVPSNKIPGLQTKGAALVPIVSMINHSCEPNCFYTNLEETNTFQVKASRDIKEGEELFITYVLPNQHLLDRQDKLKNQWCFECSCNKCNRELEELLKEN